MSQYPKTGTYSTSTNYRVTAQRGLEHLMLTDIAQKQPGELPANAAEWELDPRFGNGGYVTTENGGKAAAFRNKKTNRVVIAFSPLDVPEALDSKLTDIDDIHDGGKKQWEAMREQVQDYQYVVGANTQIEMAGHSLGAGIAQHALHDTYAPNSPFRDWGVKGYGYDGIGAAEHMEHPERLNQGRMTHVLAKGNDLHTVSGKHAGDTIHAVEPSNKLPVVGDGLSHRTEGLRDSFERTIKTSDGRRGFVEKYEPKLEQDTGFGKIAKQVERFGKGDSLLNNVFNSKPAHKLRKLF